MISRLEHLLIYVAQVFIERVCCYKVRFYSLVQPRNSCQLWPSSKITGVALTKTGCDCKNFRVCVRLYLPTPMSCTISLRAEARALARQHQHCLLFRSTHNRFLSGTASRVSTLCLPDVTAHDQVSQAFPLCICILQAIKYWR